MTDTNYLIRLDDACPWMDKERWLAVETILDRYAVRPVVAVVPDCQDPELRIDSEDPAFWDRARAWQSKGWAIGLHGFEHRFVGRNRGLVPLNDYTEFAGLPIEQQREKIRSGWQLLREQHLEPTVWVAPAHTFDRNTLRCLLEETTIRIVSDGLARRPFARWGFTWLPQQLWRPRSAPPGTWTICLHPNEMTPEELASLDRFLEGHAALFPAPNVVTGTTRPWGVSDALFGSSFLLLRSLKKLLRKSK